MALPFLVKSSGFREAQQLLQSALISSRSHGAPRAGGVVFSDSLAIVFRNGSRADSSSIVGSGLGLLRSGVKNHLSEGGARHWLHSQSTAAKFQKICANQTNSSGLRFLLKQSKNPAQSAQHEVASLSPASRLSSWLKNQTTDFASRVSLPGSFKLARLRDLRMEWTYQRAQGWGQWNNIKQSVIRANGFQDSLQRLRQQVSSLRGGGYQRGYSYRGAANPNTVLYGLIGVNVAVWLLWQVPELQRFMERHFLASVDAIADLRLHTAITANFSHTDFRHLALNMISLYFFGQSIGYQYGGQALLGLYLAGGLGCVASYCLYWTYYVPWKEGYSRRFYDPRRTRPCQGASGSVNAILICSILADPLRTVWVNLIIPMPAFLIGAIVIYSDLSGAIGGDYASRVGYSGHLGGAAVGVAAWAYLRRFRFR